MLLAEELKPSTPTTQGAEDMGRRNGPMWKGYDFLGGKLQKVSRRSKVKMWKPMKMMGVFSWKDVE